jgi:sugar transferase (PEP-CTERM/EpsH1 system associated)
MKLFILTSRFPYPLDKGDKLRAYHQIKELSKNNSICLVSLTEKKIDKAHIMELEKICTEIYVFKLKKWKILINLFVGLFSNKPFQVKYFYQSTIHKKINRIIKDFKPDHIYCQLIRCASYVQHNYHYKKTIDYMDAFSKGIERRINQSGWMKPIFKAEANRLLKFENLCFEYFDHHTIISEQDRDCIFHEKKENIKVISNGIDANYFKPVKINKSFDLVFVGNLSYAPNIDTALYICNELLPALLTKIPTISILISGANPSRAVTSLQNEHVTVKGWIEDIRTSYASAKIFIAPLRIGTGLQNKLLEAMSMEIPCITSTMVNKALMATDKKDLLIGDTKEEYIELILQLLNNEQLCNSIGKNGRKYIVDNFNWKTSTQQLENTFQ